MEKAAEILDLPTIILAAPPLYLYNLSFCLKKKNPHADPTAVTLSKHENHSLHEVVARWLSWN